ncbi:MAG: stage III sporulation protein AB, partial [Oscillospiraceae bacterium]|nr:stage III sporulation protein AB [Oscillospiraceae bacterium]
MPNAFEEAASFLPPALRTRALALPSHLRQGVNEFRLRVGRELTVVLGGDELPLPGEGRVTGRDLELT